MALRLIQPPAQAAQQVSERLALQASSAGFRTRKLAAAQPASLAMAAPHPVFQLDLTAIGEPHATERARMSGWRWLITSAGQVVAAAHASADHPTAKAAFSHVNEGPQVRSAQQALALAEQWPEVRSGRFALGVLQVPALFVEALWLRDEDGKDGGDHFVPLQPAPAPLEAMRRYGAAEFERHLATMKAERGATEATSN